LRQAVANPVKLKLLFFLLISTLAFGQQDIMHDYSQVDEYAKSLTYKGDLKLLVSDLTKNYAGEADKGRAIFVWIADNIAYDIKTYNKNNLKPFKCKGDDCDKKYIEWEDKLIERTLNKKMAVCEGYARLFKRMCDYAGLRTDIVAGYTKNDPSEIGRMGSLNHAWNGIIIDGEYHYLDVTWAAGGCSQDNKGKLQDFYKRFDDYYWLTPPAKHFRDHFPADTKLPHIMVDSKQKYKDAPYINPDFIADVTAFEPNNGILYVCVGDTVHFAIRHKDMLWGSVQLNSNVDPGPNLKWDEIEDIDKMFEEHKSTPFNRENYVFTFDYLVSNKNLRYIDVYFDHHHTMRYKVKVVAK